MKWILVLFILFIVEFARLVHGTCVLESDFGFILNCNFKKSGLFRVRNLGGVKAHFGLGFSVGDELGFPESIGNLEGGRRRALNYKTGALPNNIGVLPASRLPTTAAVPPIVSLPTTPSSTSIGIQKSMPIALTPKPKSKRLSTKVTSPNAMTNSKRSSSSSFLPSSPLMTEAASLPLGVPAFKPIPLKTKPSSTTSQVLVQSNTSNVAVNNRVLSVVPRPSTMNYEKTSLKNQSFTQSLPIKPITQNLIHQAIPPFQRMPSSVSRISNNEGTFEVDTDDFQTMLPEDIPKVDLMGHTVEELAAAANVSVQAIRQAIYMRQQQLLAEYRANQIRNELIRRSTTTPSTTTLVTTTTTTSTTSRPEKRQTIKPNTTGYKVMNAPKEYYPVGYDKNFDDNFTSKVDLPSTTFTCGDQKHFPGLYADIDLGCMVFHVCALTDDGLIMKSFLCPESTLFDQTILKCNWWFYVDCKSSKSLYDSNIPVSKSYQLMKSLTYFSNYNKQANDEDSLDVDIEALKNTVITSTADKLNNNSNKSTKINRNNEEQTDWEIVVNSDEREGKSKSITPTIERKSRISSRYSTRNPLEQFENNEQRKNNTSIVLKNRQQIRDRKDSNGQSKITQGSNEIKNVNNFSNFNKSLEHSDPPTKLNSTQTTVNSSSTERSENISDNRSKNKMNKTNSTNLT